MIITTTSSVEGHKITEYFGVCTGEAILGANVVRDLFAGVRDFVGGRSGAYEKVLRAGKDAAIEDMQADAEARGGNAIVGVDLDYEVVGDKGSMMMVVASGTAVRIE
ncbi:MAG: heavy metal-binding domain-containing protein [Alphaproteobacteria bacterium]|nr:heavy metal-binding domain-containing protein [Alphaproteobacteria bacterium]